MRILLLVVAMAGCGDPFGTERAAQARRIEALEKQIAALEQGARARSSDFDTRLDMGVCLADAERAYWNVVEANGRKKRVNRDGTTLWTARDSIWTMAEASKRLALDECRLRFAKD